MSTVTQRLPADRRFEFSSAACPSDTFAVVRMNGFEAISRPYRFELVLVCDDPRIDLARVLAAGAALRILAPDGTGHATPYAGVLAEFDQLHQAGGFTFYRAVLVPRLWQLSLYRSSEVYLHEQSIPEIVESIFKGARLNPANDYALEFTASYRPRSYVCQYQETPLAFVSRWLEREGIYYYFEQVDGIDRLVLLDDKVAQPAQAVAVNYRPADELDVGLAPDSVQTFVCRTRPLPRSLVLQDYNHRRANVPLVAQVEVSVNGVGEEMLYGENFRSEEEGKRYATLRAQELRCGARVFSGEATAVGLRSGHFMDLSQHYREDFNGRYLVTEITHEGSQAGALLAGLKTPFNEREGHTTYTNSFIALPAATQFRPARTTPRPRVAGTMNATIDAEGSGDLAELDAYGQYKVQIPFDRTDKGAAKGSAPVRMASPYAGSDHGMHFPLHKGTEVLLSFNDGDPDQPVIVGAVPNSQNPNVVDQRNPQDNLISTKGGNQMLMADTKGKEVIWLHSPFHKSSIGIGSVHPDGGGSIYTATTGGSDSVSFGNSNSMSFGPSNSLSLGSSTSLGASFSNSVSFGGSIGIDVSSGISWKANLGRLPSMGTFAGWDGIKSLSIDDSKGISLSRSFGGSSTDAAEIKAGALATDISTLELETSLMKLRLMIASFSALNFAQSVVFGMAVNASGDGAVLGPNERKAKADEEENFLKDEEDKKAKDKEALKCPIDVQKQGDAAVKAWREKEEKKIDARYVSRAADHVALSSAGRTTLQGWPGIVGKFGLDAVSNVTAMALIQAYGRTVEAQIMKLKLVSEMSLGVDGITQSVNGDNAPDGLKLRTEFSMNPTSGMKFKVAEKTDNWNDDTALSEGQISLHARRIALNAGETLSVYAPAGSVCTVPASGTGDYAGLSYGSGATDFAVLRSLGGASMKALNKALELCADTIEVGYKVRAPALLKIAAVAAKEAAAKALQVTRTALAEATVLKDLAKVTFQKADGPLTQLGAGAGVDAAQQIVNAAKIAFDVAEKLSIDADARMSTVDVLSAGPLLHGLSIDQNRAALVFGAAGWEATYQGLALNFGNASAKFEPLGVTLDGNLIKLG
jgi:type VI secretion system VgrG family protein